VLGVWAGALNAGPDGRRAVLVVVYKTSIPTTGRTLVFVAIGILIRQSEKL
jgi:hypothetical protein